jgi:hypothetical protein
MALEEHMVSWCPPNQRCVRKVELPIYDQPRLQSMSEQNDLLSSRSLCNSHADTKNSIGAQLGLVLRSIKLVQELVNFALVLDIDALLDESGSNDIVNVGNSFEDTYNSQN